MEGADAVSAVMLRAEGLTLRRGTRTILDGVSFEVPRGGLTALMGPSGSGKTTILRTVAGLEPFEGGSLAIGGVTLGSGAPLRGETLRHLRREVGLVFQFHYLFEHLTALENVTLAPLHAHGVRREVAEARGRALLASLGVEHRGGALPRELSGGEAQRVAIARALAVDPPLLMLDEPTASLDPARRDELGGLLRDLVAQGRTMLVSTHDIAFAQAWASKVLRLEAGQVIEGKGF
jgi:ABC-type polar amino acid transport system ATPase subunit